MNGGTRSTFVALALVAGLGLTVVGGLLYIDRAARTTVGPKGQKMREITNVEIDRAMARRQTANVTREGRAQVGEAMLVAGLVLLGAGGLAAFLAPTGDAGKPDQP
jgi:hypothetical protein